jgi:hypothetical protein
MMYSPSAQCYQLLLVADTHRRRLSVTSVENALAYLGFIRALIG